MLMNAYKNNPSVGKSFKPLQNMQTDITSSMDHDARNYCY